MDAPTNVADYDPTRDAGDCRWDSDAAEKAVGFFPDLLKHVKGFSGRFDLQPWQRNWIATLFGWKRPDGTRRYRECLAAVPRKNGKTVTAAGLALFTLLADGERGAEVYSAAFSRDQASLVFEPAAAMVRANPMLSQRCSIVDSQKRIVFKQANAFYRAIAADSATAHGFNASAVIFDELHTQTNRNLYDVLKTSQGARSQSCAEQHRGGPLFVSITTAGHDRHSICWEVWDYARKVRDGIIVDPYFLPVLYEIRQDEDWKSVDTWKRVNPNYGISISEDFLKENFRRATELPAYENTFRNLYLNEWTEQAVRWFSMDKWDACRGDVGELYGATCFCGLDLSSTTDITALAMVFAMPDGKVAVKVHCWVPEDSARERGQRDRVPYQQWIKEGWITATPGSSVDYDFVRADIARLAQQYDVRMIAVDRWNATQLAKQLEGDGFKVGYFGQGYASMSSPAKEFERLIVDADLVHDGNPVLRWMASNVAIEPDAAGNIKPSKAKSTERIDGIVATVMGLGVMAIETQPNWSMADIGL